MNGAQLHLAINHLPVIVPLVGIAVLFGGYVRRSKDAAAIALCIFFASAILAVPVYLTGEPAEIVIKNYPDVQRKQIEAHRECAMQALIAIEALGIASAGVLVLRRNRGVYRAAWGTIVMLSFVACAMMLRAAHEGGLIRHEEIADRGF
jgi:formate hydrogenlyase subunit 3/multisubunit Na+/H+ antiporter MnhD subunit